MYCRKCGKELVDEAVVCPSCGVPTQSNYGQNYVYLAPQPVKKKNGMAIAGFVCSFFSPILGWVFGGIGLSRAKERGGKGFAIAAIAISAAMFALNVVLSLNGSGTYI